MCVSVPVFHGALVSVCEKEEKDEEDENMVKHEENSQSTGVLQIK